MTDRSDPMMTLGQALAWIPGARRVGDPATPIARVHSDTRTLAPGDLFVALKGERFDANQFLAEAKARGAAAALAHGGLEAAGLPGLEVPDTLAALGQLAAGWRAQFSPGDLPLIAVTGSNGKTTVTQMIASILRANDGERALATAGNLNNEIGVPLTLLRLRAAHRRAVVELGMNHPGEIARLAAIARPTVALVNNAQREHQEFMASVEAVARENAAVFGALPADGVAVFPHADEFTPLWTDLARAHDARGAARRCITFGEGEGADVRLCTAQWSAGAWQVEAQTPQGLLRCRLAIAGRHNVLNALAASACALAAGVPLDAVARGLEAFAPVAGRSQAHAIVVDGRALTVVDDSYNANPDSVRAAIEVLAALPGPQLLVLGDMGEVGDQGAAFHAEIGAFARAQGIVHFLALGELSAHAIAAFGASSQANASTSSNTFSASSESSASSDALHAADIDALQAAVRTRLPRVASVLVKGSRFMKMERVVQALLAAAVHDNNPPARGPASAAAGPIPGAASC